MLFNPCYLFCGNEWISGNKKKQEADRQKDKQTDRQKLWNGIRAERQGSRHTSKDYVWREEGGVWKKEFQIHIKHVVWWHLILQKESKYDQELPFSQKNVTTNFGIWKHLKKLDKGGSMIKLQSALSFDLEGSQFESRPEKKKAFLYFNKTHFMHFIKHRHGLKVILSFLCNFLQTN
jgi:hypothetical protein